MKVSYDPQTGKVIVQQSGAVMTGCCCGPNCLCDFTSIVVTLHGVSDLPQLDQCVFHQTPGQTRAEKLSGLSPTSATFAVIPGSKTCEIPNYVKTGESSLDEWFFALSTGTDNPCADVDSCYAGKWIHQSQTFDSGIILFFGLGRPGVGLQISVIATLGGITTFRGSLGVPAYCCKKIFTIPGEVFNEDVLVTTDLAHCDGITPRTDEIVHRTWGGGTATVELVGGERNDAKPCCESCCKRITTDYIPPGFDRVSTVDLLFGCRWTGFQTTFLSAPGEKPERARSVTSTLELSGSSWVWTITTVDTSDGVITSSYSTSYTVAASGTCPPLPISFGVFTATCGDAPTNPCPTDCTACADTGTATLTGGTGSGASATGGYNGAWLMSESSACVWDNGDDGGRHIEIVCVGTQWRFRAYFAGSDPTTAPYFEFLADNTTGCPADVADWGTPTLHNGMTGTVPTLTYS